MYYRSYTLLLLYLLAHFDVIKTKVLIFTYAYNQPDFITLQHKTFDHFLQDEYEFIIFNDAKDPQHYDAINAVCKQRNLRCIDIPQEIHDRPYLSRSQQGAYSNYYQASVRNSTVVQYSLDTLGFAHDDILILIDSDMFLLQELSVKEFMEGYDIAGFLKPCCDYKGPCRHKKKFLWIGLIIINMATLKHQKALNVNCGPIGKVALDAGGYTTLFLNNIPNLPVRSIDRICTSQLICSSCTKNEARYCDHNTLLLQETGFNLQLIEFIQSIPLLHGLNRHRNAEFFLENTFVHYRAGSNYNNITRSHFNEKRNLFFDFIDGYFK